MVLKRFLLIALSLLACSYGRAVPPTVYVAGTQYNGKCKVATPWKNGVATALTDGTKDAEAFAVLVAGNDVYVAGYEYTYIHNGAYGVATVWKNGIATVLTDGKKNAEANAVFVVE